MSIRSKLLILFLVISLVPLVISDALHRFSMLRLGRELAEDTRISLSSDAKQNLLTMVSEFGIIVNRERTLAELAVKSQALEIENKLASAPPDSPRIFLAGDYDNPARRPAGMTVSTKHFKRLSQDELVPMNVNYKEQVYVIPKGVEKDDIREDMARVSTMTDVYKTIHDTKPDLFYWQYTALENGLHTSYPGKGGYPENYDPRKRPWYRSAKENEEMTWVIVRDATTGTVTATVSMPVHYPDGSFAGVTALDISIDSIFGSLRLPAYWSEVAEIKLVVFGEVEDGQDREPIIIAEESYQRSDVEWDEGIDLKILDSEDVQGLEAVIDEAKADRPGVREMTEDGQVSFWAYGAGSGGKPFPVVMLPEEVITSRAMLAEKQVLDKITAGLKLTALILFAVIIVVVILAIRSAEKVTHPISQLVEVAELIAKGDYDIRVDIHTGDEIEELGDTVNKMLVQLKERHCPDEDTESK